MGYKILDVKADIHEAFEKYFVQLNESPLHRSDAEVKEDLLEIVDENFDKLWSDK